MLSVRPDSPGRRRGDGGRLVEHGPARGAGEGPDRRATGVDIEPRGAVAGQDPPSAGTVNSVPAETLGDGSR